MAIAAVPVGGGNARTGRPFAGSEFLKGALVLGAVLGAGGCLEWDDLAPEWVRQIGSPAEDSAQAVATDNRGSVYLAGTTHGPLPGQDHLGEGDLFLTKYDSAGRVQWIRSMGVYFAGKADRFRSFARQSCGDDRGVIFSSHARRENVPEWRGCA